MATQPQTKTEAPAEEYVRPESRPAATEAAIRWTRIVVPLDGSALSERALPYATRLARAAGVPVVLVTAGTPATDQADESVPSDQSGGTRTTSQREVGSSLAVVAERLRAGGLAVETVHKAGDAATAIIETVNERHASLIVMSTHGRGGGRRPIFGSVAYQVTRTAPVPVTLVPAACDRTWAETGALRIMVTLDGSPLAEAALPIARSLASILGAEVLLFHVMAPRTYAIRGPSREMVPHVPESDLARGRAYIMDVAGMLSADIKRVATHVTISTDPAAAIASGARDHEADLVVIATHGRGGVARLVLGSVATATLPLATVPLVLVRPDALRSVQPDAPPSGGRGDQ